MDIVEFIKARLDEDERLANAATDAFMHGDRIGIEPNKLHPSVRMHVYGWAPARVLREVEAKRRMLEWAQAQLDDFEDFPDDQQYRLEAIGVLRLHLPLLALPYSDHPDYREERRL